MIWLRIAVSGVEMGKLIYAGDRRRGGVLASGRLGPLEFRRRDCVLKGRRR